MQYSNSKWMLGSPVPRQSICSFVRGLTRFHNVETGSRVQRGIVFVPQLCGGFLLLAGSRLEPSHPVGPPAPRNFLSTLQPFVGRFRQRAITVLVDIILCFRIARRVEDCLHMARMREDIGYKSTAFACASRCSISARILINGAAFSRASGE